MGSLASRESLWFIKFLQELDAETRDLTRRQVLIWQKRITIDAFEMVVDRTPVDYGHARANWDIGINRKPSHEFATDFEADVSAPKAESKAAAMKRARQKLTRLKAYDNVHIVNNVSYVTILEEGGFVPSNPGPSKDERLHRFGRVWVRGGYSVQAPRGIVRNALWHLKRKYK
jgi:hypothetical protein